MGKKILFVSCGKRDGNTFQAAKVASDAAAEAGAEISLVEAIQLNGIGRGCFSCMKCQNSFEFGCVFNDDVTKLVNRMPEYDILVFCAPVYFSSFGTQAKGVIDRLISMVKHDGEDIRSPLKGKTFALISTSGSGEGNGGVKIMRASFLETVKYFRGTFAGELYFPNCDILQGGLKNNIEMPDRARAFGRMLADFHR